MPKCYSEIEREVINTRLLQEAGYCLKTMGVKKTTVDELVRRVKIPKGTFYLFYPCKEVLFYQVIMKEHDEIEKELVEMVSKQSDITCDTVTDILFHLYKKIDETSLPALIGNHDIDLIMKKLPNSIIEEHFTQDDDHMDMLFQLITSADKSKIKEYSSAFRCVFLSLLHKREIGEDMMDEVIYLLIRGLVIQLF